MLIGDLHELIGGWILNAKANAGREAGVIWEEAIEDLEEVLGRYQSNSGEKKADGDLSGPRESG